MSFLSSQKVLLSDIDFDDHTFRITTRSGIEELANSIRSVGLLNMPILWKKSKKSTIVCGFRRLAACRHAGRTDVQVRLLPAQADPLHAVKIAILDNSSQRALNYIEMARSFAMLEDHCGSFQDLCGIASELGLPHHPDMVKKTMRLSNLSQTIQQALLDHVVSLATALELGNMTTKEGALLAHLFQRLRLNSNMQRELIRNIKEISIREDRPIFRLLQEDMIQKVLSADDLDSVQKGQRIRQNLKQRRYPHLSRAEKEFAINFKSLKPGSKIKLTPPVDFEGSTYTLSLYFKDLKELLTCRHRVDKMIQHPNLIKLLSRK